MHIENPEYTGTLSYMGADADPHSDVGEYAADLATGRLTRRYLRFIGKPRDRRRDTNLAIMAGYVVLKPMPVISDLTIDEARRLAEDLTASIGSAEALDDFITTRFGPAD